MRRARSMIVAGRNPPSRWSCSRTLGARRMESASSGTGMGPLSQVLQSRPLPRPAPAWPVADEHRPAVLVVVHAGSEARGHPAAGEMADRVGEVVAEDDHRPGARLRWTPVAVAVVTADRLGQPVRWAVPVDGAGLAVVRGEDDEILRMPELRVDPGDGADDGR